MSVPKSVANREIINRAMSQMIPRTLRFRYMAADGSISDRDVEPYELRDQTLFAFCTDRQALRQFKLERMSELEIGVKFTPRQAIVIG